MEMHNFGWYIWKINYDGYTTYHVSCKNSGGGRMSSSIQKVVRDDKGFVATTRSGNQYVLLDEARDATTSTDQAYIEGRWFAVNGIPKESREVVEIEDVIGYVGRES